MRLLVLMERLIRRPATIFIQRRRRRADGCSACLPYASRHTAARVVPDTRYKDVI